MTPERLTKTSDFAHISKNGEKIAPKGLVLQYVGNADGKVEVGFTVTKKIGNSVIRNRVKRRLRAAAREILGQENIKAGKYVLIGRNHTLERDFVSLKKDLKFALHQLGLFN